AAAGAEAGSEAVAARIDLAGTRWQWMQMVTPVETFVPDDPGQYLMEFMADGVIGIQADCNSGSGTYETNPSEGSISINITNTTLALCPEGSLSDQFIRSLNAAAIYFDQDGNLFIDLFADGGTMEFAPN
ncbi:MAG: META domain-containing protein, partial [Candidatus Promineifilaceae bacterium]